MNQATGVKVTLGPLKFEFYFNPLHNLIPDNSQFNCTPALNPMNIARCGCWSVQLKRKTAQLVCHTWGGQTLHVSARCNSVLFNQRQAAVFYIPVMCLQCKSGIRWLWLTCLTACDSLYLPASVHGFMASFIFSSYSTGDVQVRFGSLCDMYFKFVRDGTYLTLSAFSLLSLCDSLDSFFSHWYSHNKCIKKYISNVNWFSFLVLADPSNCICDFDMQCNIQFVNSFKNANNGICIRLPYAAYREDRWQMPSNLVVWFTVCVRLNVKANIT